MISSQTRIILELDKMTVLMSSDQNHVRIRLYDSIDDVITVLMMSSEY